jgi:hypothetical protein
MIKTAHRFALALSAAVVVAAVVSPDVLWAQVEPQSVTDKTSPPAGAGKPATAEEMVRFDDTERSGTPCAVPGVCGLCDCPKLPASVKPAPGGSGGTDTAKQRPDH